MSGLQTLMDEGLDVRELYHMEPHTCQLPTPAMAEMLEWHSTAAGKLPDADITVLMWLRYSDGTAEWHSGYLDGERWVDCTGMPLHQSATVTHWAEPEGPGA